jgi:hypothetical protein
MKVEALTKQPQQDKLVAIYSEKQRWKCFSSKQFFPAISAITVYCSTKSVVLQSSQTRPIGIGIQNSCYIQCGKDTWLLACDYTA